MTTEGGREGGGGQSWVLGSHPSTFPAAPGVQQRLRAAGEERSRGCNLQALPGLTSFLSLCLLKLLPAASGFPEGSSRAEAGEGSGRGVEESCCSHPGPRLGLHGKVSAGAAPPSLCLPAWVAPSPSPVPSHRSLLSASSCPPCPHCFCRDPCAFTSSS